MRTSSPRQESTPVAEEATHSTLLVRSQPPHSHEQAPSTRHGEADEIETGRQRRIDVFRGKERPDETARRHERITDFSNRRYDARPPYPQKSLEFSPGHYAYHAVKASNNQRSWDEGDGALIVKNPAARAQNLDRRADKAAAEWRRSQDKRWHLRTYTGHVLKHAHYGSPTSAALDPTSLARIHQDVLQRGTLPLQQADPLLGSRAHPSWHPGQRLAQTTHEPERRPVILQRNPDHGTGTSAHHAMQSVKGEARDRKLSSDRHALSTVGSSELVPSQRSRGTTERQSHAEAKEASEKSASRKSSGGADRHSSSMAQGRSPREAKEASAESASQNEDQGRSSPFHAFHDTQRHDAVTKTEATGVESQRSAGEQRHTTSAQSLHPSPHESRPDTAVSPHGEGRGDSSGESQSAASGELRIKQSPKDEVMSPRHSSGPETQQTKSTQTAGLEIASHRSFTAPQAQQTKSTQPEGPEFASGRPLHEPRPQQAKSTETEGLLQHVHPGFTESAHEPRTSQEPRVDSPHSTDRKEHEQLMAKMQHQTADLEYRRQKLQWKQDRLAHADKMQGRRQELLDQYRYGRAFLVHTLSGIALLCHGFG